jgi:hypothetical protein
MWKAFPKPLTHALRAVYMTSGRPDAAGAVGTKMGFTVGSFRRAPLGAYEFSIFVISNHKDSAQNRWLDRNFERIARDMGPDAVIVKGYDDGFSNEVKAFLEIWLNDQRAEDEEAARAIWRLLDRTTCLLIARKDIRSTNAPLLLVPIAPASRSGEGVSVSKADAESFTRELMQ